MPRFSPDIKPPMWGPPSAVAYAVRENAHKLLGANPIMCLPLWERGFRTQIFDVFGNVVSATNTAHAWDAYGYFTGSNVSGSGVLISLTSGVPNTAFSVFIASRRISHINFRDHISVGVDATWRASVSMSGTVGSHISFGNGTGYAGNSAEIASGDDFTAALVLDRAASTRRLYVDGKSVSISYTPAEENFNRVRVHNRVGDDRMVSSSLKTALAFDSVLSADAVARLNYEPYTILIPVARPVYFDLGATENKTGVLAITNDSSLGIGGIKGALGSASFTAAATFSPAGIKSANGYVSFSSASEFGVSGILEQSDDKIGAVVFVNESIVGTSGVKNALGGFGISHAAEVGVSGVKGVLMPELSQASGAAVSSSEISGSVYTNKNTGILYAVATLSSTKPSVAQIQAGQNHLGAAAPYATSQSVSTYGLQSVAADGLTYNTPYYWHFQHKDGDNIDSTVITSAAVRTTDLSITLDFPDTAPCSLLGYQVWSKLTVTDDEIAALWSE